jgi:hypothetical protein
MRRAAILAIFAASLLATRAPNASPQQQDPQIVQRFVCERTYVNFAYGVQNFGIFINGAGGVYRFDASKSNVQHSTENAIRRECL